MPFEIIFMFVLLGAALFLFATDYVSFDIAAIILLASLMVTGILAPEEGLAGISNPATVTIGAMFVLSEGLRRTGILRKAGTFFADKLQDNFTLWMLVMLLFISLTSSFINNTAVIIIFIPILINVASRIGKSPTKLLMPLAFAGIMGGTCTYIGTSTNILVSSIASDRGVESFGMFDFAPMGLILLAAGFIYLFVYGFKALPARREERELTKEYEMQQFLTDLVVEPSCSLVGELFDEERLTRELDLDVLRIFKPGSDASAQRSEVKIEAGDILRIRGSASEIDKLIRREGLSPRPSKEWGDIDLEHGRDMLVEAAVAPESSLEGSSLKESNIYERHGAIPLAIRHHGELKQEDLNDIKLSGGDSLLLSMSKDRLADLEQDQAFVVASEVDVSRFRPEKTAVAATILGGVVLTAALGILSIVVSAVCGVIIMILTGCLTSEEAYEAINWKIIMLLAGVIPIGTAMDNTGAAGLMAESLISMLENFGPRAILAGFYLLTMGISAIMSTNASAALLAPLAIEIASQIDVNPQPFILTVSYAASLTFITPFGHHANTLIYGAGHYSFTDFTRIGLPLNIIFWVLTVLCIPVLWPF